MKLLLRWFLSAGALMAIALYLPGVNVANLYTALIAAMVLGLVNVLIRPIILILTLPVNIITLGLFTLVVNAFMFWLVSSIVKGFSVAGFWPAFWGSIIMMMVGWLLNVLLKRKSM